MINKQLSVSLNALCIYEEETLRSLGCLPDSLKETQRREKLNEMFQKIVPKYGSVWISPKQQYN